MTTQENDNMKKTDLRVIKTLRQIDEALLDCLQQTSFQKITVEMLCQSALINRSTFYKYYIDKYDLLEKYLDKILMEFREHVNVEFINASPSNIHNTTYTNVFRNVLDFIFSRRKEYLILWRASIDRQIYNEMIKLIHDNILNTMNRKNTVLTEKLKYVDLYAYLFASNMMSLVHWWLKNADTICQKEVEQLMADNMRYGLFKTFKQIDL